MAQSRKRRKRTGRPGVVSLNRGSSSQGRGGIFQLNQPGGTFMSGRPSGGSPGNALLDALASPAPSIAGPLGDVGPGPNPTFNEPVPPEPPSPSPYPAFQPPPIAQQPAGFNWYPLFQPPPLQQPRWRP